MTRSAARSPAVSPVIGFITISYPTGVPCGREDGGTRVLTAHHLSRLQAVTKLSDGELDALVEEATVDAYDEYEQLASFHVVIEERLAVPFRTTALGVEMTVTKIDLLSGTGIAAICSRGKYRQAIGILDLPLPIPPPAGAEWIDAYRRWAT
jgi:hypothetical protein